MKNTHLEHLEDDILNSGSAGGKDVISFLRQFGHMLTGIPSELSVTTKWDGAPAIVCGTEPVTGRFFVGTKSVFNKVNPKICFDDTDVDRFYKGQLADKLKDCLEYLPQLNISGIVQGDLLYTQGDKRSGIVGGNRVICFTPNTITYAVPLGSRKASAIHLSKLGIVFHTVYKGDTLQTAQVVPQKQAPKYYSTQDVFVASADFADATGSTLFNPRDAVRYQSVIKMAEGSLKRSSAFLDNILLQGQSKFVMNLMLKRFFNEQIRSGKKITNTKDIVSKFAKYYTTSINIEISSKKSARAIQRWKDAKAQGTQFIAKYEKELYFLIASYISIRTAKQMVLRQLNKEKSIKTFVGARPTTPEGYVAHHNNKMLKFVDDEFRLANITVDKQWDSK